MARHFQSPRIVHPSGARRLWWLLALALLLGLWSWQVYDLGRRQGGHERGVTDERMAEYERRVQALEAQREALRLKAATLERSAQIDRDAVRRNLEEIRGLQADRAALQQEVALLQGLVSKGQGALYVKEFRLRPGEGKGRYRYAFTVTQVLQKLGTTEGEIRILVRGTQGGKAKRLSLKELTGGKTASLKMRFKHYQEVSGVLQLPAGFEPKSLTLELRPKNRKLSRVTRVFDWKPAAP